MTIETQLNDARLANATLREKLRRVIEERDELQLRIKRLRQYEDQCNSLSQKFCKSLIIEGVPAVLSALESAEKENDALKARVGELRRSGKMGSLAIIYLGHKLSDCTGERAPALMTEAFNAAEADVLKAGKEKRE